MKIISGGKKDYYDYLQGIYGIDDLVVYDRRNSYVIKDSSDNLNIECWFKKEPIHLDAKKKEIKRYASKKLNLNKEKPSYKSKSKDSPFAKIMEGSIYRFILEVGYWHYGFEIERYLDDEDDKRVHIDYRLIEKKRVDDRKKRISEAPMSIAPCVSDYWYFTCEGNMRAVRDQAIENPILSSTYIPSVIDANDMWNELYEYISSLRDKEFEDSRTNEEHIESNGFDKKTSFRNIK